MFSLLASDRQVPTEGERLPTDCLHDGPSGSEAPCRPVVYPLRIVGPSFYFHGDEIPCLNFVV